MINHHHNLMIFFHVKSDDANDIRPLLTIDGFDIRQSNDDSAELVEDPGKCSDLGLEATFEKVLDFTYDRGTHLKMTSIWFSKYIRF